MADRRVLATVPESRRTKAPSERCVEFATTNRGGTKRLPGTGLQAVRGAFGPCMGNKNGLNS